MNQMQQLLLLLFVCSSAQCTQVQVKHRLSKAETSPKALAITSSVNVALFKLDQKPIESASAKKPTTAQDGACLKALERKKQKK